MCEKILYDKLIEYSKSSTYPLHMPGHKRNTKLLQGVDPFDIDITEITDFDNLHNAEGIIKESMENAVKLKVLLKVELNTGDSWLDAK